MSMRGKTVVITGATSGIGEAAARALVAQGARVVFTARDEGKAAALCASLGNRSDFELCDLERPTEVQALAARLSAKHDRIDVLINNAGGMFATRQTTVDGFERTFALNHLAPFVLTTSLRERLSRSSPARVVIVSSDAHKGAVVGWDDLQMARWRGSGWPAYCQSKLLNLLFARGLVKRFGANAIGVHSVHPGFVRTGFARNNGVLAKIGMTLLSPFARSPEKGAETLVWAAAAPELAGVTGRYYVDKAEVTPARGARDDDDAERLWLATEALLAPVLRDTSSPESVGSAP